MIAARHFTLCPDCDSPISPGDMIDRIGIYFVCADCFDAFELANKMAPPIIVGYPVSSMYEAE